MKRFAWLVLVAAGAIGACAQATPEQQIINDAAEALGGAERIQAVKTLVIQGEGSNGNLGQDMTPEATGQAFKVTDYRRAIDIGAGRARVEQTRTPNFVYFQGPQAQKQIFGIDGDVAYNVAANGNATRASNAVASDRRAELYHHPLTIVRAALDPAAMLTNPRTQGSESVVDVTTASGLKFTLATDTTTKLPTRVVSMADNTNLGDVAIETSFADYQDVSGLKLPASFTTKTDQTTTANLRVTSQTVDGDTGDLAAPAAAASAAPTTGVPPANVTVEKIADGVWFLAGQSHHSVLVEFADHTKLIETPQNDTRALAVIAKAKETVPNKPLTHVIVSHHHFDHSGGVRAAISQGLTLIVQENAAQYFRDTGSRPHTIVPDALAMNPQPTKVETVGEDLEIKDATRTISLHHIAGNPHADTLLMVYFPRERLLVLADAYTPGGTYTPYAPNLLENITKRKLRVDRIIPLHGAPGPFDGLVKAAAAAQAPAAN
jgi:glyoxylase-like metal-dependent hydrolase (beta-lactamase superfamily II)